MFFKARLVSVVMLVSLTEHLSGAIFRDTLQVFLFDPIVVTGTRTAVPRHELPLTLSVIPTSVLKQETQQPLLDVVSVNVPGLFVTQRTNLGYGVASGAGGIVTIRGLGASPTTQVLVLIDGRPDIMGLFGHPLSDVYSLHNVKQIEVIRGPASLLYGSNAMGGAINIITDHNPEAGWHGKLFSGYGSFATKQVGLHQTYTRERFSIALAGGWNTSAGYRTVGKDDYAANNGNLTMNYQLSRVVSLTANGYFTNLDLYDPGLVSNPFYDHHFDIKRRGGDVTLEHHAAKAFSTFKVHHNFGHHLIHDPNFYESEDYTTGAILSTTLEPIVGGRYLFAADFRRYGGKAFISGTWKRQDVEEVSGLLQVNQKIGKWLTFDGGVRYTQHSTAGSVWIPAIGTVIALPRDLYLRGQYSTGYRNPTINELFLFMPSNASLKPEYACNTEFALEKSFSPRFNTSLTFYKTQASNLIEKSPTLVNGQTRPLYQNKGTVTTRGIELDGSALLSGTMSLRWAYSLCKFSKIIASTPQQKLNLAFYFVPLPKFRATIQNQWINGLYSVVNPYSYAAPTYIRLKGFWLTDLSLNYNLRNNIEVSAGIKNLLNTTYAINAGFPLPGRSFNLGLIIKK